MYGAMTMTEDTRGFRMNACASPLVLGGVDSFQTIPSVTGVAFLAPPRTLDTVDVDAPRGTIQPGQYFSARYMSNAGWHRASFLALTSTSLPGMRERVTIRMLHEPKPASERAHRREKIGIQLTGQVKKGGALAAGAAVSVEVVDASAGGVCVETGAKLATGDVLFLEGPKQPEAGADFEVTRADPTVRNRYGGRFLEEATGKAMFEQLVEAAQEQRSAQRTRAPGEKPVAPPEHQQQQRGMHHRDER